MINHGFAANPAEAAMAAINAGCDMDMESRCYISSLDSLVNAGKVSMDVIDDAVRRILSLKFELGLFDDPYKWCDTDREKKEIGDPAHAEAARDMARKSMVLLKNDNHLLPLSKNLKTIAVIGPMVKLLKENKGFWDVNVPGTDSSFIVSQWEGIKNKVGSHTRLLYAKGCDIGGNRRDGFAEALKIAREADAVILSIGERRDMTGEAKSRSDITIPGVQEELLKALLETGKPVVVLINTGRPLVFPFTAEKAPAILYTWWLGSEAGNAIADVLFGDYNPSAKLTMTFPRSVGQIPIYYNHFNTGRPAQNDNDRFYRSAYIDLSLYPQYEFGYGLSYSTFAYTNLQIDKKNFKAGEPITVRFTLTNTGTLDGEEIAQLYIRDLVGSVVRPVAELKDFKKILLKKGESATLQFVIDADKLSFYRADMTYGPESGEFEIMVGASSRDIRLRDRVVME
jgi:beta-glucosidase